MTTLELQGRITENGQLEIQLPTGLPAGEVTVRIDVPGAKTASKTGAEIGAMLEQMEPIEFVDPEITDPVEWVKAQRRKEADRLKPYWDGEK